MKLLLENFRESQQNFLVEHKTFNDRMVTSSNEKQMSIIQFRDRGGALKKPTMHFPTPECTFLLRDALSYCDALSHGSLAVHFAGS